MTAIDGRNRSATNKLGSRLREFPNREHVPMAAIRRGVNKNLKPTDHRQLNVLVTGVVRQDVEVTLRTVRESGHAAFSAGDSYSALRMAAVIHPDVVLLLVNNPTNASKNLAQSLRSDFAGQKILIIGIAGCPHEEFRRLRRESDFDLVLASPFDSEILETVLFLESVRVEWLETGLGADFVPGERQKVVSAKAIAGIAMATIPSMEFFGPGVQAAGKPFLPFAISKNDHEYSEPDLV